MMTRRIALFALFVFPLACSTVALGSPHDDPTESKERLLQFFNGKMAKREGREFAAALANRVMGAAHPTGQAPDLLGYSLKPSEGGKTFCVVEVEYFGVLTNKRYPATITVLVDVDETTGAVDRIEFLDLKNKIKSNENGLSTLRRTLNDVMK